MFSLPPVEQHFKREVEKRYQSVTQREWQSKALEQIADSSKPIFVAEVCPGGGKTMFGCLYAASQLIASTVDTVTVCLVPSLSIKDGWVRTAKKLGFIVTGDAENFTEDANFRVVTYAGAKQALKNIPVGSRVLLIADEYHHAEREKEWGLALESISECAYKNLLLSGTPWRTEGYIALLKNHGYYEDGKVKPDYAYTYADDLGSTTRGTVPLHFELVGSTAYIKTDYGGQVVSEYSPPLTDEEWESAKDDIPMSDGNLGKHVGCDNVYKNETAVKILERVKERLEHARNNHCSHSIALIVTRSKREADNVGRYLRDKYGWTVSVIHSGTDEVDTQASKRIRKIQDELTKTKPNVPEAIVSVGMISEGVDIPSIKVIGYLSAISTMLYIIQVIFRAGRRIPMVKDNGKMVTETRYYDDGSPTMQKAGYVIAPAEPTFVYLAANLKTEIKSVVNEKESDDKKPDEPKKDEPRLITQYVTESNCRVDVVNSCLITPDIQDAINYLPYCPSVIDEYCSADGFIHWVNANLGSNSTSTQKAVIERIRSLREKYAVEFSEVRRNVEMPNEPSTDIDYDSQIAETKAEISRLVNLIRWSKIKSPLGQPYADLDNDVAYRLVNRTINKRIGITTLSQSTLATRIKWIESARNYYEGNIHG